MAMEQIGGAGGAVPEPGSGPPGAGDPAGGPPLHAVERATATALEWVQEAEAHLAGHAGDLPATRLEQAVLKARVGALADELRAVRDFVATLAGRAEQVGRDRGRAEGARRVPPPAGLSCGGSHRDEAVAPRRPAPGAGDTGAGWREVEPPVSRRAFIAPWPVMTRARAARWGAAEVPGAAGVGERGGGTRAGGYPAGKLRASGFGPLPGTRGGPR
jgi:hypothetical protein